ncbi:MAG: GNAT family N-acetyltransferase [Rhodospirillales bacterium]|nr:MAG: GNAT family N-acetyltransferase [Rhodospirillales bacterium]
MIELEPPLRRATPADAAALAELVDIAGDGLPVYLWTRMAQAGETPWDVGQARARRKEGGFSYRNAVILEHEGGIAACLIGYPLADQPAPIDHDATPAMFVPLEELERLAPGSWYVNVLATYEGFRGRGYGARLLAVAEQLAAAAGKAKLSVIVSDANPGARRLYERCGYRLVAERPMVEDGWKTAGTRWLLLVKPI